MSKSIPSESKTSIDYILSHKLWTFGIVVIGIGIGLVFVEILRLDIKAIFWPGMVVIGLGIVGLGVLKSRILWLSIGMIGLGLGLVLATFLLEISSLSDIKAIFWLGIGVVLLGGIVGFCVFDEPKPQTLWLSAGIICLGIGLVLAAFLLEISSLSDIKAIFWLGIGVVLLGIVGLGVLKPRILWLSIGIICLGIGLIFAETLYVQQKSVLWELVETLYSSLKDMTAIFRLGIILVGIGVMILGFAVCKHNMIGILGVVVSAVGIILGSIPDDDLLDTVKYMLFPLHSIATSTANVDTKLQAVKTHTSDIDSKLQKVVEQTKGIDSLVEQTKGIDSLVEQTKGIDSLVEQTKGIDSLVEQTKGIDSLVDSLIKHTSRIDDLVDSLVKTVADRTLDDQTVNALNNKIDQVSGDLKSQKATIETIKDELDKAKKAQNSVRLLTDFEDSLKSKGFLNTDRSIRWLWLKKYYNLSKYLGTDSSSVKMVPIGQAYTLKVQDSLSVKLKRLVSHLGTLKKDKDYTMVENDSTTITFINPLLGRMDILAVVKRQ